VKSSKPRPIRPDRRAIAAISVGVRHRRDLGDIDALAASIGDIGLLHPIVITPDATLIAGARRLEACKRLGWTHIPVTVVGLDNIVRGEFAENNVRKDFTLSEAVAIKRALEPIERAAATERQGARTDKHPEKFSTGSSGRALDNVAKVVGKHRTTIAKAEAIVEAAEAEPQKFGHLLTAMDRTGRVNGVYRRLKNAKQAAEIRKEPPPLPGNGPYRVIVADPPWPYEKRDEDPSRRGVRPYPTMSIKQICGIDVASLAHDDCILWLWTTNHHPREAFEVIDAWGFEQKTILTWAKDRMGYGDWLRGQSEHCLMAVRGKPTVTLTNQTTLLHAPVGEHSVKPVEFYELVESLCPAPRYADLFSRYQHNERWDCHGDEARATPHLNEISDGLDIPGYLRRDTHGRSHQRKRRQRNERHQHHSNVGREGRPRRGWQVTRDGAPAAQERRRAEDSVRQRARRYQPSRSRQVAAVAALGEIPSRKRGGRA
jgi:N6-adenosine-specific RNA methylase IME4